MLNNNQGYPLSARRKKKDKILAQLLTDSTNSSAISMRMSSTSGSNFSDGSICPKEENLVT